MMGSRAGTALTMAGAAVGLVGVVLYASGFQVHLSPAIVSLLLVKTTFAAAGGLMITGAILSRRALLASRAYSNALGSPDSTVRLPAAGRPQPRDSSDSSD
ncbi:MAG: hypothetical protein M3081_15355 [Gemmatimonadota bacterium]|nr:hypothetical protein [Gemmatimonadota bacterium]